MWKFTLLLWLLVPLCPASYLPGPHRCPGLRELLRSCGFSCHFLPTSSGAISHHFLVCGFHSYSLQKNNVWWLMMIGNLTRPRTTWVGASGHAWGGWDGGGGGGGGFSLRLIQMGRPVLAARLNQKEAASWTLSLLCSVTVDTASPAASRSCFRTFPTARDYWKLGSEIKCSFLKLPFFFQTVLSQQQKSSS